MIKKLLCFCYIHSWTKWSDIKPTLGEMLEGIEKQERRCEVCNLKQIRYI